MEVIKIITILKELVGLIISFMMIYYLQISAFYFPTFAKADCTIFALLVGWLVGVTINFPSPNCVTQLHTEQVPSYTIQYPPEGGTGWYMVVFGQYGAESRNLEKEN